MGHAEVGAKAAYYSWSHSELISHNPCMRGQARTVREKLRAVHIITCLIFTNGHWGVVTYDNFQATATHFSMFDNKNVKYSEWTPGGFNIVCGLKDEAADSPGTSLWCCAGCGQQTGLTGGQFTLLSFVYLDSISVSIHACFEFLMTVQFCFLFWSI